MWRNCVGGVISAKPLMLKWERVMDSWVDWIMDSYNFTFGFVKSAS